MADRNTGEPGPYDAPLQAAREKMAREDAEVVAVRLTGKQLRLLRRAIFHLTSHGDQDNSYTVYRELDRVLYDALQLI